MEVENITIEDEATNKSTPTSDYEPLVAFFVCKWCTYAAADLAGSSRIQYPTNIRIFMLPCTGKMDIIYALKAFEEGLDGVLVSG